MKLVETEGDNTFQEKVKESVERCKQEFQDSLEGIEFNGSKVIYFVIDTSSSITSKERWCYVMALQRIKSSMGTPTGIFVLVTFSSDMHMVPFGGEMYERLEPVPRRGHAGDLRSHQRLHSTVGLWDSGRTGRQHVREAAQ